MDNQRLYDEVTAKLTEAKNCQNKYILCSNELQGIYSRGSYDWSSYYHLMEHSNEVIKQQSDWGKKRDDKLNEAFAKALDIIDNEMDKNMFNFNSLGFQAMGNTFGFIAFYNIRIQYSTEVLVKFAKVTAKGMDKFPFDIRRFAW